MTKPYKLACTLFILCLSAFGELQPRFQNAIGLKIELPPQATVTDQLKLEKRVNVGFQPGCGSTGKYEEVMVMVKSTIRGVDYGIHLNNVSLVNDIKKENEPDFPDTYHYPELYGTFSTIVKIYSGGTLDFSVTTDGLYKDGGTAEIVSIRPLSDYQTCHSCGNTTVASSTAANRCLDYQISLGSDHKGRSAGSLFLYYDKPAYQMFTVQGLNLLNLTDGIGDQIYIDSNDKIAPRISFEGAVPTFNRLKQLRFINGLAVIDHIAFNRYTVKFYHNSALTGKVQGLYTTTGAPHKTIEIGQFGDIEYKNGVIHHSDDQVAPTPLDPHLEIVKCALEIVETVDGHSSRSLFEYDQAHADWTLHTGSGSDTRSEHRTTTLSADGQTKTCTYQVKNSLGQLVHQTQRIYKKYSWGFALHREREGYDSLSKTTSYDYYQQAGATLSKLKSVSYPDGSWVRYTYDAAGHPLKTITPYKNSPLSADESQCRVVEEQRDKTVEHIAGVEVGRSYRSTFNRFSPSGGYTYEETQQITCTVPGAARNNPSNRIYISRVIDDPDHPFHGKPVLNLSSEGTGTIYDYRIAGNRQLTTIYSGTVEQRTAGGQFVVVDGTRTQTQTDLDGRLLSSRTYDIQSGLLTASIDHIAFDRHGRLLETYNNLTGRSSSTTYACCGVETSTDETGSLTAYTYDSLKRQNTITRHGLTTEYVYDAMGRVIETRRHGTDGSVVTLSKNEYDAVGNLRDSYQRSTETTDNGHALFHKTAHQDTTAPDGSLISTTHYPDGSKRIETHYLDGSLKSVSGSAVAPEYYEYGITDAGEQYTTVYSGTSNQAALWTKSYTNFKGEHYKTVQSSGAQELSFYDENGRVTKLQHADGEITLYDYNSKGQREITCIDMNRNGLIDYDGSDRITRTLFEYGQRSDGTVVRRTRQLVWSEHGKGVETQQLRSETTLDGLKSWNYTFGIVARSVTEIDHKTNTLTSRSYATDHSYTETIQQNGRTLSVTSYDSKGHRLTQKTYTYDPHGRTATVTDLFSGTTTYSYYDNGQIKTLTTPVPEAGKAAQTTTYTYDKMGRQKTLTTPDGTVKHYNYYLTGQLKNSYSTGSGQSGHYPVSYTYDDAGRQKTLTTYKNHTVDSTGTLTGTIAEVTTWHYYDTSGLLKRKTRGDGSAADKGTSYTYTLGGKVKTRTWARGSVTTYDYLTDGRLQKVTYSNEPAGTLTPGLSYTYNRLGQIDTVTDGAGLRRFSYTAQGQLASETLNTVVIDRNYDQLFRPEAVTVKQGGTLLSDYSYSYDRAGRLNRFYASGRMVQFDYVVNTNMVGTTTYKSNGGAVVTTTHGYDKLGRHRTIDSKVYGKRVHYRDYDYTDANQRASVTHEDGTEWNYSYDPMGQIIGAQKLGQDGVTPVPGLTFGYGFDHIGNRTSSSQNGVSRSYTPQPLNQYQAVDYPNKADIVGEAHADAVVTVNGITAARQGRHFHHQISVDNSQSAVTQQITVTGTKSGVSDETESGTLFFPKKNSTFSYDDDGNTLSDGKFTYKWNGENRLIEMERVDGTLKLEFAYDYMGRRYSKKVYEKDETNTYQLNTNNSFIYDGYKQVVAIDQTANVKTCTYWVGEQIVATKSASLATADLAPLYFYLTDANKNVCALVSESGEVAAKYDYTPFGKLVNTFNNPNSAFRNPFLFSSEYHDEETGLVYYNYRYYNPELGRWMSQDPIGERGGLNLYGFCYNSPTTYHDYLGGLPLEMEALTHPTLRKLPKRKGLGWPKINFDLKPYVLGAINSFKVNIGGKFLISPVPFGALYAKVELAGKTFACLNSKNKYEIWGEISISGGLSYAIGGAHRNSKYGAKEPKGKARNEKALDYSTGNLVKLKKLYMNAINQRKQQSKGAAIGIQTCGKCPTDSVWDASIELTGNAFAGAGPAISATVGYKWEWDATGYKGGTPVLSGGASWGVGVEVSIDVTATGAFKGKITDL